MAGGNNPTTAMIIDGYRSGNVGIGNTAPLSKLGITGNASIGATYGAIAAPTSGLIVEGNVGIGTTNPGYKLEVNGAISSSSLYVGTRRMVATGPTGTVLFGDNTGNGENSVYVGTYAGDSAYTGGATVIGSSAGRNTGTASTVVGFASSVNRAGGYNTIIGAYSFGQANNNEFGGSYNTSLGTYSGWNNRGVGNIFIGYSAGYSETGSNKLYIANSSTSSPLIYGDFATSVLAINGNVGIGTTSPGYKLDVVDPTATASGGYNKVMMAHSTGLAAGATSQFAWGKADVAYNQAEFNFYYAGDGSSSNQLRLGLNGVPSVMTIAGTGNIGIGTTNPTLGPLQMGSGAYVTAGGVWTNASDRNLKTNFQTLDPQTILEKIQSLPITQWSYRLEDASVRHIGPIAQDFYSAFGLGGISGNTSISTIDPSGVALLGIQALNTKTNNFITQTNNQITGLTENQNKIVDQLTGQLADQNLTVDNKLQLIGQALNDVQTHSNASLQAQIDVQKSDLLALQEQMADIQTNMYIERYDELWSFYQNFELAKVPLKNALENVFDGKITASDIEALNTIKAKDIEATNSLKGKNIELSSDVSGTSKIKAGELESEKILTTEAKVGMKMYITPMSNTFDQVLYVNGIENGESFKVKINKEVTEDIEFNWLIVK
jgi:hypothetical protein